MSVSLDEDSGDIFSLYGDNSIRRWSVSTKGRVTSSPVTKLDDSPLAVEVSPAGDLLVCTNRSISVFSALSRSEEWTEVASFTSAPGIDSISVRGDRLVCRRANDSGYLLVRYSPIDREVESTYPVVAQEAFCLPSNSIAMLSHDSRLLVRISEENNSRTREFDIPAFSSIDARVVGRSRVLIMLGHAGGEVSLWRLDITRKDVLLKRLWEKKEHGGSVTAVRISEQVLISGGVDRTICMFPLKDRWDVGAAIRLHQTLQCQGMRIDDVKGESERVRLRSLLRSADK